LGEVAPLSLARDSTSTGGWGHGSIFTDFVLAGDGPDAEDWDLHPGGDRFVTTRFVGSAVGSKVDDGTRPERQLVVTNWFTELQSLMEF
jgi:hypothetical protein